MKAARLYQFNESLDNPPWLVYEDVPDPVIEKPTNIIVRIGGAGICRTDLQLIKRCWRDQLQIELPLILGHENAGWVEEIGSAVKSFHVGDPVIIHPMGTRDDAYPASERRSRKREQVYYPGFNCDGGFAEYMLTEERMLLCLPGHLSPKDAAPLACAGLTAYHAVRLASIRLTPGSYVLLIGAGGLGHVAIQLLRALSAAEIIVVDKSALALDLSRTVGAHYTFIADDRYTEKILALTRGLGVEAVIDFVGKDSTVKQGISITRKGGYYYLVGCDGQLTISTLEMILSEKTIVGILGGTFSELRELLTMIDRGLVALTINEYPLSRANEALRDLNDGRSSGRSVLIP